MDWASGRTIWGLPLIFIVIIGLHVYPGPGSHNSYFPGQWISLRVNSLTSIHTALPLSYNSLPFCIPVEDVWDMALNPGELLMGDRIQNSPYSIPMYKNDSKKFLCQSDPLSAPAVNLLKRRIDEMYQVNMILDNLPVMRYTGRSQWRTGFPVGVRVADSYYVFNHLKFKVLINKENGVTKRLGVVGFEVVPCSYKHNVRLFEPLGMFGKYPRPIQCDPSTLGMRIKENESIVHTYEVMFEESDIKWQRRWDAYLPKEGLGVHWFSITNSMLVIAFLSGLILDIFRRTTGWNLSRYEKLDQETNAKVNDEKSSEPWELVTGNSVRTPVYPMLLCVMTGNGVQILGTAVVTVLFAALGFMSQASRGTLLTVMIFLYLAFGSAAGYIAVRLWRTTGNGDQKDWLSVSLGVACFFPGIVLLVLSALNFLLWSKHSTAALPLYLLAPLKLIWVGISVPLTLLGGYIADKAPKIESPVQILQIAEEIPHPKLFLSWLSTILAGTLPFGTLYVELFFIMSSLWMGRYYTLYGFLLIVAFLLVTTCAETSIVLTYKCIRAGDLQWWWKSFFASGSSGIYILVYCIKYLISDLKLMNGPTSVALYLGYSLLIALAFMLATGAVGFLSTFWFLHYLSSLKLASTTLPDSNVGSLNGSSSDIKESCEP